MRIFSMADCCHMVLQSQVGREKTHSLSSRKILVLGKAPAPHHGFTFVLVIKTKQNKTKTNKQTKTGLNSIKIDTKMGIMKLRQNFRGNDFT